ncbi:MAG: class I SAM-dependent methyltransferase [Methanococcaceae archaeon]
MTTDAKIDNFLSIMVSNEAYPSKDNLRFKYDQLFGNIDFKGKNVLEIGGGQGVFCFYAAIRGAKWVVNLEPEGAGSKSGYIEKFRLLKEELGIHNVELIATTFQEYNPDNIKFDIILLYNSINHLDEKACIELRTNSVSWNSYKDIFRKIYSLSNNYAKIIIGDCSNKNLFPLLGLKNPLHKSIEWHKHQSPIIWTKLLKECGFCNPVLSWTTFNRFGKVGKYLFGNKYLSFFLISHFVLKMDAR